MPERPPNIHLLVLGGGMLRSGAGPLHDEVVARLRAVFAEPEPEDVR
jgi:hypothetical protein